MSGSVPGRLLVTIRTELPRPVTLPGNLAAESIRVYADVLDERGAAVAVTGAQFLFRRPRSQGQLRIAGDDITVLGPGAYAVDVLLDEAGAWRVRFECAGPRIAAGEGRFSVSASSVLVPPAPQPVLSDEEGIPLLSGDGVPITVSYATRRPVADLASSTSGFLLWVEEGQFVRAELDDFRQEVSRPSLEAEEAAKEAARIADEHRKAADEFAGAAGRAATDASSAAGIAAASSGAAGAAALQSGLRATEATAAAGTAQNEANRAADAAGTSVTNSDRASSAAYLAEQKAVEASLAAAQALLAGTIFTTADEGLQATAEGRYFNVVGAGKDFAILYRKEAGVAVEKRRYPSTEATDAIPAKAVSGLWAGLLTAFRNQPDGRIFGAVDDYGRRFWAAGQSLVRRPDGTARWQRLTGGPSLDLTDTGPASDGPRLGLLYGAFRTAAATVLGGWRTSYVHADASGAVQMRYGPRHLGVAGLWIQHNEDGSWALSGPKGRIIAVQPGGAIDYAGSVARRGLFPGADLVIQYADGRAAAFRTHPTDGALRLLGRDPVSGGGGTGTSSDFSDAEREAWDAEAYAYSSAVRRRYVGDLVAPTGALVVWIVYGQSLGNGWECSPALSKTGLPPDLLMIGQSVHPTSETSDTWTPIGDSSLRALAGNVVTTSSPRRVMTDAEVAALGFGAANLGETPLIGALTHFRDEWLRHRGRDAGDPTNRFLLGVCGRGGQTVLQLSAGANPDMFNRIRTFLAAAKARADAEGVVLQVGGVLWNQGENDYTGGTSYSDYLARCTALFSDIRAHIATALPGQTGLVPIYACQSGGQYARDGQELAIGRAQIAVAQAVPGVFMVANNQFAPDYGDHLTSNGSRWLGQQIGKVMTATLIRREGWECTRPLAFKVRKKTLLGQFHVPVRPLRFLAPWIGRAEAPAFASAGRGIYVSDASGAVPVTGAHVVAGGLIEWTLGRETGGTVRVWLGQLAAADGAVCIADSDQTRLRDRYEYIAGSGQEADEDVAALAGHYDAANFSLADVQTAAPV